MRNKILLVVIPLILSIGIIPAIAFTEQMDSPRKQMVNGIAAEDVVCKSGLTLMIRISGDAACVKPATAEKLAGQGWGIIEKEAIMKEIEHEDTRPNILLIVLDDVGFSDLGFTASEINTPVMNSLANSEILMTNFHVSPTCSPTRAMLLTGVDNHLNGLGTMSEFLVDNQRNKPGYEGFLNYDVVTAPTLLSDAGYNTFMTGKWHLSYGASEKNVNYDDWKKYDPYARGFTETFTTAIPGNHFSEGPVSYGLEAFNNRNGERVPLPDSFYSGNTYTDYMIDFIDMHHDDGKPMYMYLAFWESHWPLQTPQEFIDRYDGVYDKGWDEIRKERFELQQELGIIPGDLELPPLWDKVQPWDELTPEEQAIQAKKMQVYAGMTESMDENIGRIIQHLKDVGEYDNTLMFIFSDNGAESSDISKKVASGDDEDKYDEWYSQFDNSLENIGSESSLVSLGIGWAQVGSTPLYREKGFETEGGTLTQMIVKVPGETMNFKNNAFAHVQDITPTVLDYADVEHPGTFYQDREVHTMNGKSLKPLFEGDTDRIYAEDEPVGMELFGNRALYKGDWKALQLAPPFGDGEWKLYNLSEDVRELIDLSSENPELLEELIMDYDDYSERVGVIPPEGLEIPR